MITLEKAKSIVKKQLFEYSIEEIVDIGESWAFCFDTGENPLPGVHIIAVSKTDGNVKKITIPPLENIDLLEGGKTIWKRDEK